MIRKWLLMAAFALAGLVAGCDSPVNEVVQPAADAPSADGPVQPPADVPR